MIIYFDESTNVFVFESSRDGVINKITCGIVDARNISNYFIKKLNELEANKNENGQKE